MNIRTKPFTVDDLKDKTVKPAVKRMTEAERQIAMKKNWGTKAYNNIQRFRKIWDKEGCKLAA